MDRVGPPARRGAHVNNFMVLEGDLYVVIDTVVMIPAARVPADGELGEAWPGYNVASRLGDGDTDCMKQCSLKANACDEARGYDVGMMPPALFPLK